MFPKLVCFIDVYIPSEEVKKKMTLRDVMLKNDKYSHLFLCRFSRA
jgi:hypothetical protein